MIKEIDHSKLEVVIFDVDGTLYNQAKLRRLMLFKLVAYYLRHPRRLNELKVILTFRKLRETNTNVEESNLAEAQYEWVAQKMHIPASTTKQVIERWMDQEPLNYLLKFKYPNIDEIFQQLKNKGIKIAIFSDLPVKDKLAALNLSYDFAVCSTDPEINKLKPNPTGLNHIVSHFKVKTDECLFIGDRMDRDGEAAEAINMPYLIINKKNPHFFADLAREFN